MISLKVTAFVFASMITLSGFGQSQMQLAKMKQRLMTELQIDNVKADSVVSIVEDFYANARSIKSNADVKDDQRKLTLQNNRKGEMVRLRAQLSNEQIKELQQVMQEMKQERQNRRSVKDSASAMP